MDKGLSECIHEAIIHKDLIDEYTSKICDYLNMESSLKNNWYYRDGFFRVDVLRDEYDVGMQFIEEIIGCSYCYTINRDGLTFMMSLTTLASKL